MYSTDPSASHDNVFTLSIQYSNSGKVKCVFCIYPDNVFILVTVFKKALTRRIYFRSTSLKDR